MKQTKFIFITGGVVSSLGKGITAGSIGRLLKSRDLKVVMQKLDPYINVDPGTMSPLQHGEVFVTEDGAETDLDLGHYERFIDESLNTHCSVTAGKVYLKVIEKERAGNFNGGTVQVIPHITNQIKEYIWSAAKSSNADVVITEIGGTVGDFESLPFLEAIRQVRRDVGYRNTFYIHTTLVPYLKASKEVKTKPTQHSVKELRSLGISPDMIVLRTERSLPKEQKDKISLFCDVKNDSVIEVKDCRILYDVVNELAKQNVDNIICNHFKLNTKPRNLTEWNNMIDQVKSSKKIVDIYLVGHYVDLPDAYLSVIESIKHGAYANRVQANIKLVKPNDLTKDLIKDILEKADGIVIADSEIHEEDNNKLELIKHLRSNNVPFLGINSSLDLVIIEYAKNIIKYSSDDIYGDLFLPLEKLKLGSSRIHINEDTLAYNAYNTNSISERFRTKITFNNKFMSLYQNTDLNFSGVNSDDGMVSIVELRNHEHFLACKFNPEFKSRPNRAHPLFINFIKKTTISKK